MPAIAHTASERARPAFALDSAGQRLRSTAKALWWTASRAAGRAVVRPAPLDGPTAPATPKPDLARVRRAYLEAFEKDAADIAAGLYPAMDPPPSAELLARVTDLWRDAREVEARRRRRGGVEARTEAGAESPAYPTYYKQNFHFQSGGWFTPESAARYDAQVEALFAGAAGAMRRRGLSLLAKRWRGRDTRGLAVVDVACGAGSFLADLRRAFPRATVAGVDLSAPYVRQAMIAADAPGAQAMAERLPFADASLDAVTCVYLFHELPPRVRPQVAAELARVLKPGGVLVLADSVQPSDEPGMARLLESFPVNFHEPYYASYAETDLPALFATAGLRLIGEDKAFLTKALLLEKS